MIDKSILLTSTMGNVLGTMRRINAPMLGHKKGQRDILHFPQQDRALVRKICATKV